MKKFVLALMSTAAIVFGFGGIANAYPPSGDPIVFSTVTPASSSLFEIKVQCAVGESVSASIPKAFYGEVAPCDLAATGNGLVKAEQATGVATFTITAPAEPGTYTGTVTGSVSGDLGSFTFTVIAAQTDTTVAPEVTVPAGGLPATGSSGIGTSAGIAIGLLIVGVGLFAVATVRRRDASIA